MIKQNIKTNLKLLCYPTQFLTSYSRQDIVPKPTFSPDTFSTFSLTFYASSFGKSAKRCEITQETGCYHPF